MTVGEVGRLRNEDVLPGGNRSIRILGDGTKYGFRELPISKLFENNIRDYLKWKEMYSKESFTPENKFILTQRNKGILTRGLQLMTKRAFRNAGINPEFSTWSLRLVHFFEIFQRLGPGITKERIGCSSGLFFNYYDKTLSSWEGLSEKIWKLIEWDVSDPSPSSVVCQVGKLLQKWGNDEFNYLTPGKSECTSRLIFHAVKHLNGQKARLLFLPADGRELKIYEHMIGLEHINCLGVEIMNNVLSAFFKALKALGEIGGEIPVIREDIDNVILDNLVPLNRFNLAHLDYNGPFRLKHAEAIKKLIDSGDNPLIAVTVNCNPRGWDCMFAPGEYKQNGIRILEHMKYSGLGGSQMETYFIEKE